MKTQKTQAIVLRRTNYGEADRVIQVITPYGKKSVIAKGARREKSKLAGGIELFAISDVVIGSSRGELDVLVSARLVYFFRHILEDYDRLQFGYLVIKLISKAAEMLDEPEWFDVLSEILAALNAKSISLKLVQTWFYLRYASLMGYELSLRNDADGGNLLPTEEYRYDVGERGLVLSENGDIGSDHIKLLRLISSKSLKVLSQVGGIETVIDECLWVARQHAAIQS